MNERRSRDSVCALLVRHGVFDAAAAWGGVWIGSVALDLHGAGADTDIVCQADDLDAFAADMTRRFGACAGFGVVVGTYRGRPSVIARFSVDDQAVEMFARTTPVTEHESWRHFRAAERLLALGGEALAERVRALKASGLKTEPAFARALGLDGDGDALMLRLADAPDSDLRALLERTGLARTAVEGEPGHS